MADSTYSVRIDDTTKQKISDLIKDSGLNSKDFMGEMIQAYEINKTKEIVPLIEQDLTELQTLTRRINNIYMGIGERIDTMSKAKDEEYRGTITSKQNTINTLQEKIQTLEELSSIANADVQDLQNGNKDLLEENVNIKKQIIEDIDKFTQVNNSDKALIEEYRGKIDTLTGIVEEYKGYKVEIIEVQVDLKEISKQKDQLENENIKLNNSIDNLNKQSEDTQDRHIEQIESIKGKLELEKEKTIVKLERVHQEQIQKLHDDYNLKVKSLLDEIEVSKKPKRASSKKKDVPAPEENK